MPKDYSNSLAVTATPEMTFKAITEQIDLWWTSASNKANQINDQLRVEFGSDTFKVMKITESTPKKSLTWEVVEAHIGHEKLAKKDEWVGTKIHWVIHSVGNGSRIDFRHEGLTSEIECWALCSNGWDYFLDSFKAFLDTGKGTPFCIQG